ncbi:hypothetical protein [Litorihabitans aurantiacus]|uniref:Uncharacterized protein n=1 Tax=Litorihabitans aurantiacus TaxID=1930061 RepID=A0AA38CUM6_9MICO|nr:hypothetical protein [Litorihabitans aurantiacus]GMA32904.1 hypothetical protein GCM10025875_28960 [Litorihabitans aurantiacus]
MSQDWSQNRAIRDLNEAMAAQAAAASARQRAVERRIQALQGDLTTKVDTLTFQLNALIELGDIRDELTLYIPTRRARDAAVALTRAVLRGDGDLTYLRQSPDLASDGDYWLVPAALAIVDARQGTLDADAADTALRLDRGRAAPFLVAVTTLVGHPELTTSMLDSCFQGLASGPPTGTPAFGSAEGEAPAAPAAAGGGRTRGASRGSSTSTVRGFRTPSEPDTSSSEKVTHTERVLWRAATAGMLGQDAVTTVRNAVAARLALAQPTSWSRSTGDLLHEAPASGTSRRARTRSRTSRRRSRRPVDGAPPPPRRTARPS